MPFPARQCPACGHTFEPSAEASGVADLCPACQANGSLRRDAPSNLAPPTTPTPTGRAAFCAVCQSPLDPGEADVACPDCGSRYHTGCWAENCGCAVYGCPQVPRSEPRQAVEIPSSFWGQETKPCPRCGQNILAAAVRCRHCGTTFASARPQDATEFQSRAAREARLPRVKSTILWLFAFSLLPCTAPFAALATGLWYPSRREDIESLPSIYGALRKIGFLLAISQCLLALLFASWYAATRGG